MLGRRDGVAERRVHHHDSAARGGWNIHIVNADPGPPDDLEARCHSDDLWCDLGGRANGQPVIVRNRCQQRILVLAEVWFVVNVYAAITEDLHGGFGQLVGNEYTRFHLN